MNLEQFYLQNYRIVYGYLLALCGDEGWAEDLTSETFLRAFIKLDSFDGRGKPSTWLCSIGKNLYLNQRKRHSRQASLIYIPAAEDNTMEDNLIRKEQAKQIFAMSQELEEPKKTVFRMRLNGNSFREIGDALGKSENWARVTFFRVRNVILDRLEGSE